MADSSNSSAKRATKSVVEDARKMAAQRSADTQQSSSQSEEFAAFTKTNAFAQIMLNPSLSPEAKRDAMVKALTFSKDSTKEENRAKIEAFSAFKEYLQEQRKILNKEGIKLQDTEAFAELQSVIDEMTKSSLEFQERVKPLLEVLSAVFEIRKHDKITDVYKEIQDDKAWQEEKNKILAELQLELEINNEKLVKFEREKAILLEDKSFFGLGPVQLSSKTRIAEIDRVDKPAISKAAEQLVNKILEQKKEIEAGPNSDNPELNYQKAVLKEFLNLSKDENRDRQKGLIEAAVKYVDTSDSRLKTVLGTLNRLGKHAEVMSDANGMLRGMHLIMDESLKHVTKDHEALKADIAKAPEAETPIAQMTREEKLRELNEHITLVDDGAVDIANSIGGLTKHSVQIQAYKDTLRNESGSTKRLHLEGVSQMGEQLMSVISAISAAATSESRSVAANSFAKMAEQNQTIISQEVVRNATNIEVEANQISKLVGELQDYGDVLNASSAIATQGYGRMRETVDAIRKVSGHVQDAIKDLVSERADAGIASGQTELAAKAELKIDPDVTQSFANPFAKIKQN
jgi:hypothetical protein